LKKRKAKYPELKTGILTIETLFIHNTLLDYENLS